MSNGTYLNDVYAIRLHKSNAREEADEAEDMLKFYRDRMLVLAAMSPQSIDEGDGPVDWPFYVRREVDSMFEEIQDHVIRGWMARYIAENPGDCRDEFVDTDWPDEEKAETTP